MGVATAYRVSMGYAVHRMCRPGHYSWTVLPGSEEGQGVAERRPSDAV